MVRKWPLFELRSNCWRTAVLLLLLESNEDLGLFPSSENAETLESASAQ